MLGRLRRIGVSLCAASAFAVLAPTSTAPSTVPVVAHTVMSASPPPVRILPLGDSITYGYEYGSYRSSLWGLLTADGYEVDFVGSLSDGPEDLPDRDHEGRSGWRIGGIEERARDWVRQHDPDIVLLHIGTNDLIQGASAQEAADGMDDLLDALTGVEPAMTVIVSTLIPLHDGDARWRETNEAIVRLVAERAAAGERVRVADMADGGPRGDDEIPDGVHPNARGYAAMAKVWHPTVSDTIARMVRATPGG